MQGRGRVHPRWMHIFGLHWSMRKLNFVSSLLVDVSVFPWLRPDWTCFPCKIIRVDSCKWLRNFFKLNYYLAVLKLNKNIILWWMIFICSLRVDWIFKALQAAFSQAPWMHKMTLLCPQKNFFNLFKPSTAAGSCFGAATRNKYHDKYLCAQSNAFPL